MEERESSWFFIHALQPMRNTQYVRKSVEGLSMFLFVFAFLGNTFYVLSILTSPNLDLPRPQATAFLLESTP